MKKIIFTLIYAMLPVVLLAGQAVVPGEILDLDKCVSIAISNHPDIIASQSNYDASRSRVGQAKSAYMPQVSGIAEYSKYDQDTSYVIDQSGPFDKYNTGFNLDLMLYDFGRTSSQVGVRKRESDSYSALFTDTKSQVILGVKKAYYGLLQSKDTLDARSFTVEKFELHLKQAKKLYEVGFKPRIDVTKAEVDLGKAKLDLIKARNTYLSDRLVLANAMGITSAPDFEIDPSPKFTDVSIDESTALERAYQNRPDLKSAIAKVEAAEMNVKLANASHYPLLTGAAGYGWNGDDFPLKNEWNAGASLTIPIFTGFNVKYSVDEARASRKSQMAAAESIRQGIRLDVTQALLSITEVRKQIDVARETLAYAKQNRELAEGRYAERVGNAIEVTDAITSETEAATSYASALYDYRIAVANLENAMGEVK
jgi:outer membrane protein TolC